MHPGGQWPFFVGGSLGNPDGAERALQKHLHKFMPDIGAALKACSAAFKAAGETFFRQSTNSQSHSISRHPEPIAVRPFEQHFSDNLGRTCAAKAGLADMFHDLHEVFVRICPRPPRITEARVQDQM